jgi:CHAT domain-containing protein
VDAPTRAPGVACGAARRALLVTNPQQNLWAATRSAPAIRRALEQRGFVVDTLEGEAATRAAVEQRLADPCTEVLVYDGHATAPGGVAHDRSADSLLLAGGEALTAARVLGLPRVPAAVVLNGCTTAAPEGLGLAQAFLLAGARQAIASLDEVPAADAARFTSALFDRPIDGADFDLVRLFARATADTELPMFRVFER